MVKLIPNMPLPFPGICNCFSLEKLQLWIGQILKKIAVLGFSTCHICIMFPLINTPDVFTMVETKKSVTESEGGSTCGSTVDNNRKRGKQITGSKTVKSKKKTKLEKSLDTICANFMEVSQADVKR